MSPALNRGPVIRGILVACAAATSLVLFAAPAQASHASASATPCWKLLLNEYDATGAITTAFPIACYHEAIAKLPLDVREYSNAATDIETALAHQIARNEGHSIKAKIGHKTVVVQPTPLPKAKKAKKKKSPISTAIKDLTPGGAGSFPLPLLILGLLAILLVLAGLGGLGWRRFQGRRGSP